MPAECFRLLGKNIGHLKDDLKLMIKFEIKIFSLNAFLYAFRHMLENIGKNDDANLEENNKKDNNYGIALECLRKHLHVLE